MLKLLKLNLSTCMELADAVEKEAKNLHLTLCIAIVDTGGNLQYFRRMDGTATGSVRISQLKANTSAIFPLFSRKFIEKGSELPVNPYAGGSIEGLIILPGGVPIFSKDHIHLGGLGISGATPDVDEQVAMKAIKACDLLFQ